MKSLKESLFDSDLIKKDLPTFGSQYEPTMIYVDDTWRFDDINVNRDDEDMKWMDSFVKINALKKNVKPYPANLIKTNKDHPDITELGCYFVSIINKFPAVDREKLPIGIGHAIGLEIFGKEIRENIVTPYFKKSTLSRGHDISLRTGIDADFIFTISHSKWKRDDSGDRYLWEKKFIIYFRRKQ